MTTSATPRSGHFAEAKWLERWTAGPTEDEGAGLKAGSAAPDLVLTDHTGRPRRLSDFWSSGPALVMFWRHFGCGCGVARAARLGEELDAYRDVGLTPVIVGHGDPGRASDYRSRYELQVPILVDPDATAYRAYGVGQWPVERILYDAPPELWGHSRELGSGLQEARRIAGRPLVDDPWRAAAEFVVGQGGSVRLSYLYQYCEDWPDPRVLTTAAQLSRPTWTRPPSGG